MVSPFSRVCLCVSFPFILDIEIKYVLYSVRGIFYILYIPYIFSFLGKVKSKLFPRGGIKENSTRGGKSAEEDTGSCERGGF